MPRPLLLFLSIIFVFGPHSITAATTRMERNIAHLMLGAREA